MSYIKNLISVGAYFQDNKNIVKLIQICNLKHIQGNWRLWIDDYNNELHINDKKNISIIFHVCFTVLYLDFLFGYVCVYELKSRYNI